MDANLYATVYLSPWDNHKRNLNKENLEVDEGEEFESAIFDVKISVLPDEDEDTQTEQEADITQYPEPVLLNNRTPTEEVAILDNNSNIQLRFPLEISKNFIIFTIHQRIRGEWTKKEIEKQCGGYKVVANISDFDVDAIFCTSRQKHEEITVLPEGFLYRNDFAEEQEIRFPRGSVAAETRMKISTLAVDLECKKSKIEEKELPGSGIQSLSNIVYIHHSQPFTKNVTVKLSDTEENSHPFVFHCDESGLHLLHDVPVRRISGDVIEVGVKSFSGIGVAFCDTQIPENGRISAVSNAFGLDFDYCNILIFLHRDEHFLYLWSEIVLEADREDREEKRTKEGLFQLRRCRSPTIQLKNHDRIRVTVGPKGIMRASRYVPADHCFIYYNKFGNDNYLNIHVVREVRMGNDGMVVIRFNMDRKRKTLLHTAYFSTAEYSKVSKSKRSKQHGGLTPVPSTHRTTDNRPTSIFTSSTEEEGASTPQKKKEELVHALKETGLNLIAAVVLKVYRENRRMENRDFE